MVVPAPCRLNECSVKMSGGEEGGKELEEERHGANVAAEGLTGDHAR